MSVFCSYHIKVVVVFTKALSTTRVLYIKYNKVRGKKRNGHEHVVKIRIRNKRTRKKNNKKKQMERVLVYIWIDDVYFFCFYCRASGTYPGVNAFTILFIGKPQVKCHQKILHVVFTSHLYTEKKILGNLLEKFADCDYLNFVCLSLKYAANMS